ncbi:hypothetical protein [Silvibacterium dinghuense]|uniref:hypothetical protein n=1 Tax=Silvibacterium dinghuense TaxID=1560006 RepID=UPI0013E97551|nr:hypothetical protein [Silvibacterium dinghuense]
MLVIKLAHQRERVPGCMEARGERLLREREEQGILNPIQGWPCLISLAQENRPKSRQSLLEVHFGGEFGMRNVLNPLIEQKNQRLFGFERMPEQFMPVLCPIAGKMRISEQRQDFGGESRVGGYEQQRLGQRFHFMDRGRNRHRLLIGRGIGFQLRLSEIEAFGDLGIDTKKIGGASY